MPSSCEDCQRFALQLLEGMAFVDDLKRDNDRLRRWVQNNLPLLEILHDEMSKGTLPDALYVKIISVLDAGQG